MVHIIYHLGWLGVGGVRQYLIGVNNLHGNYHVLILITNDIHVLDKGKNHVALDTHVSCEKERKGYV